MASAEDIVRHHQYDPDRTEWVVAQQRRVIEVTEYDRSWPTAYTDLAARVRRALGDKVLELEHVGSTSVPGLAAKPIIDLDLTVADSADEAAYRPALEAEGFTLVLRERHWHEHRAFSHESPRANLHVWSPDSPEAIRHRLFRDWLREHPDDRDTYARAKRAAADRLRMSGGGRDVDYNDLKEAVVLEILERVFRAHSLL